MLSNLGIRRCGRHSLDVMTTGAYLPTISRWRCTFSNSSITRGVVGHRHTSYRPECCNNMLQGLVADFGHGHHMN
jgi:hypothetical protein